MIRLIRSCATLVAFILIFTSFGRGQQVLMGGPPPEIRNHIDTLVKALNSGSSAEWEKMSQEHLSPSELKRHSAEDRKQIFDSIRRDFGTITLRGVEGPDQPLQLHIQGSTGATGVIELTLEHDPPFKIEKVGVKIGGAGGRTAEANVEPPPVNASMSDQQIASAMNDYLGTLAAKDTFSGDVLIARDGQTVYSGAVGFADRSNKLKNDASTRFNIGSVNKMFTKAAVEQLVARGKLSLTDTIGKLLPEYPQQASRTATVDQLLHHTAGIADIFGDEFARSSKDRFRSNADYYKLVSGTMPMFTPGARTQYCNGCFIVLGAIIERVSSMPYEKYINENIFGPAGMRSTGYLQTDGINSDVALGYTRHADTEPFQSNVLMNGASGCAAGGGYSTTGDLIRYSEAVRHHVIADVGSSNSLRVGGGAPGINAILHEKGRWTVVVLANLDPPAAEMIATSVIQALSR